MSNLTFTSKTNVQRSPELVLYVESTSPSLSFTRPQELQTQISSVDFATLSKQNTNSSHGSSLRTSASHKKSLTRLFSRRKTSLDTFQLRSKDSYHGDLDSINPREIDKPHSIREKFKGSVSPRTILKAERNQLNKAEPAIQSSHNKSSISRPGSSQNLIIEGATPDKAQASLLYHNSLFHRPHSAATDYKSHGNIEHRDSFQTGSGIALRRNIVQLSSQSSNSFINDRAAASAYNFTNPSHSSNIDAPLHESKSLLELHRRYMVSADLYIQKHKATAEDTSSNTSLHSSRKEKLRMGLQIYDEHYNKAFSELYEIVKPLLLIQTNNFGSKGDRKPYVLLTIEELASFVEERLLGARNVISRMKSNDRSPAYLAKDLGADLRNNLLSVEDAEEEIRELESKEFLSKISLFFLKCCHTLADNFMGNKLHDTSRKFLEINNSSAEFKTERMTNRSLYLENWHTIARAWDYFNSKVRFYLLHIFLPAELQLDFVYSKDMKNVGSSLLMSLEKDLLHAFRDAFIIPQLRERIILVLNEDSGIFLFKNPVLFEEKSMFADKGNCISKSLVNCFGVLSSYARRDPLTPEDLQPDDVLFGEFTRCLKLYSR